RNPWRSTLQDRGEVEIHLVLRPEHHHHHCQPDRHFRRRDGDDQEDARKTVQRRRGKLRPAEAEDQQQVGRVEHQLHAHEDRQRTLAHQDPDDAHGEQPETQREQERRRGHEAGSLPVCPVSVMTPTTATSRRTPTSSKGSRNSPKSSVESSGTVADGAGPPAAPLTPPSPKKVVMAAARSAAPISPAASRLSPADASFDGCSRRDSSTMMANMKSTITAPAYTITW